MTIVPTRAFAAASAAVLSALMVAAPAHAGPEQPEASGRVLVISLPGVTWEDVATHYLPNISGLLEGAIVANLSVRVDRLQTLPATGYATLGSGTKAIAPASTGGLAFGPDEPVAAGRAGDAFERRTGVPLPAGVGHLHIAAVEAENDSSVLGGTHGLLGDALRDAGVTTAVVGNADRAIIYDDEADRHREVALGLADGSGRVSCGTVDTTLLQDDGSAPFGVRLFPDAVVAAANDCRSDRSVTLVEASDLRRALDYRSRVVSAQRPSLWRSALETTDELVGALVREFDLNRDTVMLVSPIAASGRPRLTLFALRAPDLAPGFAESASTRQPGFVSIVDLAPTIAEAAGAQMDLAALDGRGVTRAGRGSGSLAERVDVLVDADADARFRDSILAPTVTILISAQVILSGAVIFLLWRRRRLPRVVGVLSLGLLMSFPLTYWAALVPFRDLGEVAFVAFVLLGGAAAGIGLGAIPGDSLRPLVVAFSAMLATTAISVVLLGSRLQLSTVFGDSPIVAGRFNGINNVTFSQVAVAALMLGVAAVHLIPGRRGVAAMLAMLAATLVVIGVPTWGADVGGVLAGIPAFAAAGTLLAGRKIRWRAILVYGGATALAILALGFLDLARDASDRSHLGRLFERIGADGWDGFATVVQRKLEQNVRTLTTSAWRFILVPVIALAAFVAWRVPGRVAVVRDRVPELRAGLIGVAVAGALGYALNDSGIAVPGMMLAVLNPAALYLLVTTQDLDPESMPASQRLDEPRPADDAAPAASEIATRQW